MTRRVAYRFVQEQFADDPLSGEGAREHGGRWNHQGVPVLYTSSTPELAMWEVAVHLAPPPAIFPQYDLFEIEFDDNLLLVPTVYPKKWDQQPPDPLERHGSIHFGTKWLKANTSLVLQVPSVVMKISHNYLFNTEHPKMRESAAVRVVKKFDRAVFQSTLDRVRELARRTPPVI